MEDKNIDLLFNGGVNRNNRNILFYLSSLEVRNRLGDNYERIIRMYSNLNINHVDSLGMNALSMAVADGNFDAVNALINAGINVNNLDKAGRNVFFYISSSCWRWLNCKPELVELNSENDVRAENNMADLLYTRGVNSKVVDNYGFNPVDYSRSIYFIAHILKYIKPTANNLEKINILFRNYDDVEDLEAYHQIMRYFPAGMVVGNMRGGSNNAVIAQQLRPDDDPELLTVPVLRKMVIAMDLGITGVYKMKKAQLIKILTTGTAGRVITTRRKSGAKKSACKSGQTRDRSSGKCRAKKAPGRKSSGKKTPRRKSGKKACNSGKVRDRSTGRCRAKKAPGRKRSAKK